MPAMTATLQRRLQRLSITTLLAGVMLTTLVVIIAGVIFISLKTSTSERLQDLSTLQFYEVENLAREIASKIAIQTRAVPDNAESWVQDSSAAAIRPLSPRPSLKSADITNVLGQSEAKEGLFLINNEPWLFIAQRNAGKTEFKAWSTRMEDWLSGITHRSVLIYIANRQGQLVHSGKTLANALQSRVLVQEFIKNPLRQGQFQLNQSGKRILGYFQEIQATNLVLFVESDLSPIMNEIRKTQRQQVGVGLIGILAFVILMVAPLVGLRGSLETIARNLVALAQGHTELRFRETPWTRELLSIQDSFQYYLKQREATALNAVQVIEPVLQTHPDFLHYNYTAVSSQEQSRDWMSCRTSADNMQWLFLVCSTSDQNQASAVQSFAAGFAANFFQLKFDPDATGEAALALQLRNFNEQLSSISKHQWNPNTILGCYDRASGRIILANSGYHIAFQVIGTNDAIDLTELTWSTAATDKHHPENAKIDTTIVSLTNQNTLYLLSPNAHQGWSDEQTKDFISEALKIAPLNQQIIHDNVKDLVQVTKTFTQTIHQNPQDFAALGIRAGK